MDLNFVVCPAYHGATLLACLLNNHTSLTALGDTIPHKYQFDKNAPCGCGRPIPTCPFWSEIRNLVRSGQDFYGDRLFPIHPVLSKNERINKMFNRALMFTSLRAGSWIWRLTGRRGLEFSRLYIDFHHAVCEIQETAQFIDGQKSLTRISALSGLVGAEANIRVLHLIRDPRGYCCSAKRHSPEIDLQRCAKSWLGYHNLARRLPRAIGCKYLLIRYEDLCQDPSSAMRRIFSFLGVANQDVCKPSVTGDGFHLIGNQGVNKGFDGKLLLDSSWKDQLSDTEQSRLIKITEPLCSTTGYDLTR